MQFSHIVFLIWCGESSNRLFTKERKEVKYATEYRKPGIFYRGYEVGV